MEIIFITVLFSLQTTLGDKWIPKDVIIKQLNEDALQNYRDGWAVGDSDIILAKSPDSFTFTWQPANNTVNEQKAFENLNHYKWYHVGGQF